MALAINCSKFSLFQRTNLQSLIRQELHWYVIPTNAVYPLSHWNYQRYGSHGIEFSPSQQLAFVPVLGSSTIEMYAHNRASGHLTHLTSVRSPRGPDAHDGPRHVKVHPNGKILYCVTEHCKFFNLFFYLMLLCLKVLPLFLPAI